MSGVLNLVMLKALFLDMDCRKLNKLIHLYENNGRCLITAIWFYYNGISWYFAETFLVSDMRKFYGGEILSKHISYCLEELIFIELKFVEALLKRRANVSHLFA